jgi:hypothetical protein
MKAAPDNTVHVHLMRPADGRDVRLDSKLLCKVLHLVSFHGWRPERLTNPPPSATWDTQLVVPHIEPYLSCVVSETDASSLASALQQMLAAESMGLPHEVLYAALALKAIAEGGSFEVLPEAA